MARIEFEAFVEAWSKSNEQHPAWGMKSAETHSRKNAESGKYETTARTYRTVKVSRASGIDLAVFRKGDRVKVWGQESTEKREHEGRAFYDLVVWADRVEPAERGATSSQPAESQAPEDPWAQEPTADSWATAAPGGYTDSNTPF